MGEKLVLFSWGFLDLFKYMKILKLFLGSKDFILKVFFVIYFFILYYIKCLERLEFILVWIDESK